MLARVCEAMGVDFHPGEEVADGSLRFDVVLLYPHHPKGEVDSFLSIRRHLDLRLDTDEAEARKIVAGSLNAGIDELESALRGWRIKLE